MELKDLTAYADEQYRIKEEHKWADFPGFSVLCHPDTGKWVALLMRQWDGETGTAMKGECPWVWIVNLDHVTYVSDGLSIGEQPIHGHGHGLPLIQNLQDWAWN